VLNTVVLVCVRACVCVCVWEGFDFCKFVTKLIVIVLELNTVYSRI